MIGLDSIIWPMAYVIEYDASCQISKYLAGENGTPGQKHKANRLIVQLSGYS
jgi:hypothetical protein